MKALLINGSPHGKGATNKALKLLRSYLKNHEIQGEIIHIGNQVSSCTGCFGCIKNRRCSINDMVNDVLLTIDNYDAVIIGAPVYFASPAGGIISFLDRLFEAGYEKFRYKPAASFTVARRAGTAASIDVLNKYFLFSNMPIVSTNYINKIFAATPEDVHGDREGMELLQDIAENMAWMLNNIYMAKTLGNAKPDFKHKYYLRNFINDQ